MGFVLLTKTHSIIVSRWDCKRSLIAKRSPICGQEPATRARQLVNLALRRVISETKVVISETKVVISETKVVISETKVVISETKGAAWSLDRRLHPSRDCYAAVWQCAVMEVNSAEALGGQRGQKGLSNPWFYGGRSSG